MWFDEIVQDLRYATRSLRRQPGLACVAVLSSALGIGTCSAIFAIANFALFRSLPVPEPERIVSIGTVQQGDVYDMMSYPTLLDLRAHAQTLEAVAAQGEPVPASLGGGSEPKRFWGRMVTFNYFETLGVRPFLGPGFSADQDRPGTPAAIVFSYDLWRDQFGSDPAIAGKEILFNGAKAMVFGVMPRGFHGSAVAGGPDFWVPLGMIDRPWLPKGYASVLGERGTNSIFTIARLRPNTGLKQAQADLDVLAKQLGTQYPEITVGFHAERAGQLNPQERSGLGLGFLVLVVVAMLVLLMACANVANLLLARSVSRRQEIATRLAIGAGRGRLVRQMLVESTLLAMLGGIGGVALASQAVRFTSEIRLPFPIPFDLTIPLDYHVVLFAAGLSVLTGIAFGLVPALSSTRKDLTSALKDEGSGTTGWRRFGLGNALVVVQVSLSTLLLIASGLFLRSLSSARGIDTGMRERNLLFVSVDPLLNGYSAARTHAFLDALTERVGELRGVRSASYTNMVPLSSFNINPRSFVSEEHRNDPDKYGVPAQPLMVGPHYFETLGIPMVRGQDFGLGGEPVAIVNEAFAEKAFPGEDPMGRRIYDEQDGFRIVGVAAASKLVTIGEDPKPAVFRPVFQRLDKGDQFQLGVTLAVRTDGPPAGMSAAVRQEVSALDPALPVFDVKTMQTHMQRALLLPRLAALLFGVCGGMGLLIASIGLYGVVNFSVARRTREIGVRMALGARRGQVIGMILQSGLWLTLTGCVIGLALAFGVMRVVASVLYGISPRDPVTFVGVPLALILVAGVAALVPARRAARMDPSRTLHHD